MELWRLRYFVALAEELHYGRAATRLHITQPGLSQQIKSIERDIGVQLIDRAHGVRLTTAGEVLYRDGRSLLEHADQLLASVKMAAEGHMGSLRISHTRSIEPSATYALVEDFRKHFSNISLTTETAWTSKNVEMVQSGTVDVGFVQLPLESTTDVEYLTLGRQELAAAVPADHPLGRERIVRREDLLDTPMVHFPRSQGPGYFDSIVRQIWGTVSPVLGAEGSDAEQMLAAVADGKGFSIVERSRGVRLCPSNVHIVRISPVPYATYGVVWSTASVQPVVAQFVQHCRRYVADRTGSAPVLR